MTKPSKLPEWNTTQVNSTEPDQDHKDEGWLAPGGVPEKPPFQTFNYWMNEVFRWIKAWNDDGLPSWDSATDYPVGATILRSDGQICRSLQTPNINQDPTSTPAYWVTEWDKNTAPDTDTTITIARAALSGVSDAMVLGHVDNAAIADAAISQTASGQTSVNSPAGQDINFRNNGTQFASFAPTVLSYASDVEATAVFGRTRLYSNAVDIACFSHYDRSGVNDYAVAQDNAGHTHINAPTGSSIYFRINGAEIGRFAGTTLTLSDISVTSNQHLGTWSATGATAGVWFNVGGGCYFSSTNSGQQTVWQFSNPNGIVGSIRTNASATAYNTSSDPRLKSKFASVNDDKIKEIISSYASCAGEFHFLADKNKKKTLGFNAHKVLDLSVGSEMATEGKGNRTDEIDGEEVTPAGVDQSKCTPALVLAMDMALKKIEQLEIKLADLEAK